MKTYVVCVSDSSNLDRRTPVKVPEDVSLGKVVQTAVDDFLSEFGEEIHYPLFIDVHPEEQFGNVQWLHPTSSSADSR